MKLGSHVLMGFSLLVVFWGQGCGEDETSIQSLEKAIQKEMDTGNVPGVAVAVIQNGEVTMTRGFGSKRPGGSHAAQAGTLFRIGSTTKILTSIGVLQLVDKGQLDLETPITAYLSQFTFERDPNWASTIKVRHLLTHSSAVNDGIATPMEQQKDVSLSEYVHGDFAKSNYLMAPAGRMFNYSNPNFMLAGLLIEKVSGLKYADYIKKNVLIPLGMHRTYFDPGEVISDGDYSCGRMTRGVDDPREICPDAYDNHWAQPAGFAFSNVDDLAKLMLFLRNGNEQVLSNTWLAEMTAPQMDTEMLLDFVSYGFGLFVTEKFSLEGSWYASRIVEHGGDIPGFSSSFYYAADLDLGLIVLANADLVHFQASLQVALQSLAELPAPIQEPDLSIHPETFVEFVGEYFDAQWAGQVLITQEDGNLMIEVPAADSESVDYDHKLIPIGPDNFVVNVEGNSLVLTFLRDPQGRVEYLRTRLLVAERTTQTYEKSFVRPTFHQNNWRPRLRALEPALPSLSWWIPAVRA